MKKLITIAFIILCSSINAQELITPKSTEDTTIIIPDSLYFESTGSVTVGAGSAIYTEGDSLIGVIGISDLIFDDSLCVTSTLQFGGNSDTKITIDFDKDSILINYEGKLNEAGKIFIDFCREYGGKSIYDEINDLILEYEEYCKCSTTVLRGISYRGNNIWIESSELINIIRDLEKTGIEYALIKGIKIDCEQPTLSGFKDWLENKKK